MATAKELIVEIKALDDTGKLTSYLSDKRASVKNAAEKRIKELNNAVKEQNEPLVKQAAPKILFEILVYGTDPEKKTIQRVLADLTAQLDSHRKIRARARVLWYIDKGEKSVEEKKEWLIENSNCKYATFIGKEDDGFAIPKDFVGKRLDKIRRLEDSLADIKKTRVFIRPKHIKSKAVIEPKEKPKMTVVK
jgi:hypothetical protein